MRRRLNIPYGYQEAGWLLLACLILGGGLGVLIEALRGGLR